MTDGTAVNFANLIRGNDRGAISLRIVVTAAIVVASAGAGALGVGSPASALTPPVGNVTKVDVCHSAGPSKYNTVNVDVASIDNLNPNGHGADLSDIIPPFTWMNNGVQDSYAGQNWTPGNQAIYRDDCNDLEPNAVNDSATATKGGSAVTVAVMSNDTLGNVPTTVTTLGAPTVGSASLNADGTVSYTPPAANSPATSATFTYTITDADGDTSTATVTVSLLAADRLPVAVTDTSSAVKGSATAVTISVLSNDTLGDTPTLVTATSATTNGSTVTIAANGLTVGYTPPGAASLAVTDSFTYTITDSDGDTSTATVNITLDAADVQPTAVDDVYNVTAGGGLLTMSVLGNDTAGNGASTVVSHTAPAGVTQVGNTFTYTPPAAGAPASTFTFTYTINDADGDASTATVTVNVAAADRLPVAANDTYAVTAGGGQLTMSVLVNDTAGDGASSIVSHTAPAGVALVGSTFTYTPPAAGAPASTITFTYTINDADGDASTATVTITVSPAVVVVPGNNPPNAVDDTRSTPFNTPVTINVLSNDSDPDGDPLTITQAADGVNGAVSALVNETAALRLRGSLSAPTTGSLVYTPAAGFTGVDTFSYVISDGRGGTDTALVTVTVAGPSSSPTPEPSESPSASPNPSSSPIGGVTSPEPATSGTPSPAASPAASPLPDLPFVPEEEAPDALPFTGSSTDQLLALGALLSVAGLLLVVTGRRRRTVE